MEQDCIHVKTGMVWARLQEGPHAWPDPLPCCDLGHGTSLLWRSFHARKTTRYQAGSLLTSRLTQWTGSCSRVPLTAQAPPRGALPSLGPQGPLYWG